MIHAFFQAVRQLTFYEMDEHEWANRRKMSKFIPFIRHDGEVVVDFDTQAFQANHFFPEVRVLDPYGTVEYDVHGKHVVILNTYGEEDENVERASEGLLPVITLCLVHDNVIEVGDVVTKVAMLPRKHIQLIHYLKGRVPSPLQGIDFSGKRAFYYYFRDGFVSVRVPETIYRKLPSELKHMEAEEWASGPRAKILLENE